MNGFPDLATDPLQLLEDAAADLGGADAAALVGSVAAGYPESLLPPAAEIADAAGVRPAVFDRLLTAAGFRDHAELRARLAETSDAALTSPDARFLHRITARPRANLLARLADHEQRNLAQTLSALTESGTLELAAVRLVAARTRYVLGERKSYGFAHLLSADLSVVMGRVVVVDGLITRAPELFVDVGEEDAVVVFSLRRYATSTVRMARRFAQAGATVIAVTDSQSSPVAEFADVTLVPVTSSESFADSPTAVAAVCHALGTLAATRAKGARRRIARREQLARDLSVYEE